VVVELSEEIKNLGWECKIKSIPEIHEKYSHKGRISKSDALKLYLQENAHDYDVVDYDHNYLPFKRSEFPKKTLFVARSVLLAHHFSEIKIPQPKTLSFHIRALWHRRRNAERNRNALENADRTVKEADLINVSNRSDRETLVRHGADPNKIVVLPYGIDVKRRKLFDSLHHFSAPNPTVVFVGSFDYRKGCLDLPEIFKTIAKVLPKAKFKLLGTSGLFQTENQVRKFFPNSMQVDLEVIPTYTASELPQLLSDCSVGVFPSYIEGFGFGVIEMLAAGIPVIAYDSPGPSSILPSEMLVCPGDTEAMANKVVNTLADPQQLQFQKALARRISNNYNWPNIAQDTVAAYTGNCRP